MSRSSYINLGHKQETLRKKTTKIVSIGPYLVQAKRTLANAGGTLLS